MALIEIAKRFEEKDNLLIFREYNLWFVLLLLFTMFLSFGQGSSYLAEWLSGARATGTHDEFTKYYNVYKAIPFVLIPGALLLFFMFKNLFIKEVKIDTLSKKLTAGKKEYRVDMIKEFQAENLGGHFYLNALLESETVLIYSSQDEEESEKVYQRIEQIYGIKITRIDE